MTRLEFMAECGERLIDIDLALEDETLRKALKARDNGQVKKILDEMF